ncbi:uncharacterized protein LOC111135710 [Crassostrea virginica]
MSDSGSKTPLKSIGARDIIKLDYEKSGHLRKEGLIERSLLGKFVQWRQYFVVLRDGCFYVFENDRSTQPKVAFSFENYSRLESFAKPPDYDYCFKLIPRAGCDELKEHCFAASDDSGRQEWLIAIYKALHVANNLSVPFDVGKTAWADDIFTRRRHSEHKRDKRGERNQNVQKRYSDMPTGKAPLGRSKSYPLPPTPGPAYEYDEIAENPDSDIPSEAYDDCQVQRKPAPNPKPNIPVPKQERRTPPPLPTTENESSNAPQQGSYINLDLKQKIDDLPLFEGNSSDAKRAIKDQSVGTFLIRTSSQADSNILYVLVVSSPADELQFRIFKQGNGQIYINEGVFFTSLSELVEYYRKNDLSTPSRLRLAKQYGHMNN